jgi:hypothetical protein
MLLALILTPVVGTATEAASRPNILLIVVDDMGYSDIGPFGSEIKTPSNRLNCQSRGKVHRFLCWAELLSYPFHAVFRE